MRTWTLRVVGFGLASTWAACGPADATDESDDTDDTLESDDTDTTDDTEIEVETVTLSLDAGAGWGVGALQVEGFEDCRGTCDVDVPIGTEVTVTALADPGQAFSDWVGPCEGNGLTTCVVTADAAASVGAYFTGGVPLSSFVVRGSSLVSDLAHAPDGAVIVCGKSFSDAPTATGTPGLVYGGSDGWIGQMTPSGAFRWVTSTRGSGEESCEKVTVAPDGSIYALFRTDGQFGLGDTSITSAASYPKILVRLTAAGAVDWVVEPEGTGVLDAPAGRPLVHTDGKVYVPTRKDPQGVRIMIFDPLDGSETLLDIPTTGTGYAEELASAPDGDLYVSGVFSGALGDFDVLSEHVEPDLFVARINTLGGIAWGLVIGSDYSTGSMTALASDALGNLYVGGSIVGDTEFLATPPVTITPVGNFDWFVLSLDAVGSLRWVRSGGGTGRDEVTGIQLDADSDALYVIGGIQGTGNNPAFSQSSDSAQNGGWLVRMDTSFGGLFGRSFLATSSIRTQGLAVVDGAVAAGGYFLGTSVLGMGPAAPPITPDGFGGYVHFSGR